MKALDTSKSLAVEQRCKFPISPGSKWHHEFVMKIRAFGNVHYRILPSRAAFIFHGSWPFHESTDYSDQKKVFNVYLFFNPQANVNFLRTYLWWHRTNCREGFAVDAFVNKFGTSRPLSCSLSCQSLLAAWASECKVEPRRVVKFHALFWKDEDDIRDGRPAGRPGGERQFLILTLEFRAWIMIFRACQLHRVPTTRSCRFGDCFLANSFGLVGRTTVAMQPRRSTDIKETIIW